jgi:DNA-binding protein H-NS
MMTTDKSARPSLADLLAERKALDTKIHSVRVGARKTAIAQARQLVASYGLKPLDVMPFGRPSAYFRLARPSSVRKKAAAKYYDPNSGKTWSGRGKPPRWIAGQDFGKYLISAEGTRQQPANDETGAT